MAEANAHSSQKRRATGRATSPSQSSLGDKAVMAKAAQQVQSQARQARWGGEVENVCLRWIRTTRHAHNRDELGKGKEDGDDSEDYEIGVEQRREQSRRTFVEHRRRPEAHCSSNARHMFHSTWVMVCQLKKS